MSDLEGIINLKKLSLNDILLSLQSVDDDLDLKSHIHVPRKLTSLFVLGYHLGDFNYNRSKKIIDTFIDKYLRYMISYKRESRKEIIRAISNLSNKEPNATVDSLTKNLV